mgnify:CR=1 FL=1
MFDLAYHSIEAAKRSGATYADIRIIDDESESINVKNAMPAISRDNSSGFGVRVIADGAWGFAASPRLTKDEIEKTTKLAVEIAKASATIKKDAIKLAHEATYKDKWNSTYIIDPFKVSLEEKLELLLGIDEILRKDKRIVVANSELSFWREIGRAHV